MLTSCTSRETVVCFGQCNDVRGVFVVDGGHYTKRREAQETPPDWTGTLQQSASWTPAMTPPHNCHFH